MLRGSWAPADPAAAKKLRDERGIAVRFILGRPLAGRLESLEQEAEYYGDMLLVDDEDAIMSSSTCMLAALEQVTAELDADFYVVTRHSVVVNIDAVATYFEGRRSEGNTYTGCMKSGEVIQEESSNWYEPEHWRFGEPVDQDMQYPRHANGEFYAFSRQIARYLVRNRAVMHHYANEDTTVGTWMLGLQVQYQDEGHFCCNPKSCLKGEMQRSLCLAFYDNGCNGVCDPLTHYGKVHSQCILGNVPAKKDAGDGRRADKATTDGKKRGQGGT